MKIISGSSKKKEVLVTKNYVLLILVSFCVQIVFYIYILITSKFAIEELGSSSAAAGIASSMYIVGSLFARILAGRLIGIMGYKKILLLFAITNVIFSSGYLIVGNIYLLIVLRFLHGMSFGAISTAASTAVAEFIPLSRRGEGIGYFSLAQTMAAVFGPVFPIFLSNMGSYSLLFSISIFMSFAGVICTLLLTLGNRGVIPSDQKDRKFSIKQYLDFSSLRLGIVASIAFMCYASILSFMPIFTAEKGLLSASGFFFLFYAGAAFISRPTSGRIFDSKGANTVIYPLLIIIVSGILLYTFSFTGFMLLASAFLLGTGIGGIQASTQAIVTIETPVERLGPANSAFFAVCDVGFGLGPTIVGFLIPFMGYQGMYIVTAFIAVANIGLYTIIYGRKTIKKSSSK